MLNPVSMFQHGGPFMYLLLLGLPMGMLVSVIGLGLSLAKVRVPLLVWAFPATMYAALGLFATAWGMGQALEAVAYASPEMQAPLAGAGQGVALYTTVVGWFGASLLCLAATWASSLGHLRADPDDGWDLATAAGLALGGLVLGAIVVVIGLVQGEGPMPLFVGLATTAAGVGLAPMALRTSEEPASRARLAEGRLVTASLAVGAPLFMAASAKAMATVQVAEAIAHASAEMKGTLIGHGEALHSAALTAGVAGTAIVLMLGLALALPRARYVTGARLGVHLVGGALVLLPLLAMAGWAGMRGSALAEIQQMPPVAVPSEAP